MRRFPNKIFLVFLLTGIFLGFACSNTSSDESQTLPATHPTPFTLTTLFQKESLHEVYFSQLPAFRFESDTKLILKINEEETETFEAKTILEKDEEGNFHLYRDPLYEGEIIDLVFLHRDTYLRRNLENEFRPIGYQSEFDRILSKIFSEILDLYKSAGFGEIRETVQRDGLNCVENDSGFLCSTADEGLPIKGNLQFRPKEDKFIQTQFEISTGNTAQIQIPSTDEETPDTDKPGAEPKSD